MNYLDFSHKIMLYLQLKGLLFRFEVLSEAGVSAEIDNKNGLPRRVNVSGTSGADIKAINAAGLVRKLETIGAETAVDVQAVRGDGVVRKIEIISAETWSEAESVVGDAVFANVDISASGDVDIQFLNATGKIAEIENIEAVSEVLIDAVLAQALTAAVNIASQSSMSVSFAPYNTIATQFSAETATAVEAIIRACDGMIARFIETGETSAEFVPTVATAALARFAVISGSEAEIGAINAAGLKTQNEVESASSASAVMKLLVEATIGLYEGWTLAEMGGNTLEELSQILI